MKFITLLAFFVATISLAFAYVPLPVFTRIGTYGGNTFLLLRPASEATGRANCQKLGGYLAKVDSIPEAVWLSTALKMAKVSGFTYVDSWQGDSYGAACIAIYSGAPVIVTPRESCRGPLPAVCEVKKIIA